MSTRNRQYLIIIICALIVWHLIIAFSENKKVSGLFSATPKPGYTWSDGTDNSRYFWKSMESEWRPGQIHPKHKAFSSFVKNTWFPLPGYKYGTVADLNTIYWQPKQKHPLYNVISSTFEGQWFPELGYQFKYPGTSSLEVQWLPNQKYDDLKVISSNKPGSWVAYPGYELSKDSTIIKAVWKEGLISSNNNELVSGESEGDWVNIDDLFENTKYEISVTFPDCEFTTLSKFLYRSYVALNPANNVLENVFQKNLLEGSKWLMDNLIGGIPIPGTLTITKNYIEYEPGEYTDWFIKGDLIKNFRIGPTEIKSVSRDNYGVAGIIYIKTEYTDIRFLISNTSVTFNPGSTIREKIDLMLKYSHVDY